jgi:hypothetical protein
MVTDEPGVSDAVAAFCHTEVRVVSDVVVVTRSHPEGALWVEPAAAVRKSRSRSPDWTPAGTVTTGALLLRLTDEAPTNVMLDEDGAVAVTEVVALAVAPWLSVTVRVTA